MHLIKKGIKGEPPEGVQAFPLLCSFQALYEVWGIPFLPLSGFPFKLCSDSFLRADPDPKSGHCMRELLRRMKGQGSFKFSMAIDGKGSHIRRLSQTFPWP